MENVNAKVNLHPNHQSNAKNWRVKYVNMMKNVEKVVIATNMGKMKFHFIQIIHSKRYFATIFNSKVLLK